MQTATCIVSEPAARRGAILIVAAICLILVVAMLAFSIDVGYMVVTESELQNAADAGAMSGATALRNGREAAIAAAKRWAGKNVAGGQSVSVPDGDVELGRWDADTATFTPVPPGSSASPDAVRVTCRRSKATGNPLHLLFGSAFGVDTADVHATAVAEVDRNVCGLFVGLERVDVQNAIVDSYDASSGAYDPSGARDNGNVCSDGDITLSPGGRVRGDARPGKRHSVSRPGQVTGSTEPRTRTIDWEPVDVAGPAANNDNALLPAWALTNGGRRMVVEGSNTVVLAPGTYHLPGGLSVSGNGRVLVTGPTTLVLGGDVYVAGNGVVNALSEPRNLRIEMVGASATFAGNAALYADIYAPTTHISVNGNAGFYGAAFGRSIVMSGSNARLHGDESLRPDWDEYTSRSWLRQ